MCIESKRERESALWQVKGEKESKVVLEKGHTIIILFVPTRKVVFVHFLNEKGLQEQTLSLKGS